MSDSTHGARKPMPGAADLGTSERLSPVHVGQEPNKPWNVALALLTPKQDIKREHVIGAMKSLLTEKTADAIRFLISIFWQSWTPKGAMMRVPVAGIEGEERPPGESTAALEAWAGGEASGTARADNGDKFQLWIAKINSQGSDAKVFRTGGLLGAMLARLMYKGENHITAWCNSIGPIFLQFGPDVEDMGAQGVISETIARRWVGEVSSLDRSIRRLVSGYVIASKTPREHVDALAAGKVAFGMHLYFSGLPCMLMFGQAMQTFGLEPDQLFKLMGWTMIRKENSNFALLWADYSTSSNTESDKFGFPYSRVIDPSCNGIGTPQSMAKFTYVLTSMMIGSDDSSENTLVGFRHPASIEGTFKEHADEFAAAVVRVIMNDQSMNPFVQAEMEKLGPSRRKRRPGMRMFGDKPSSSERGGSPVFNVDALKGLSSDEE